MWQEVTFAECIECGSDDVSINSTTGRPDVFHDGDEVRCNECGLRGMANCDAETPVHISWQEEDEQ